MDIQTLIAKAYHQAKEEAIKKIIKCFHPECDENSINSHILQKNGIVSSIAEEGHVMEMHINKHKEEEHFFRRIGYNKAFSFNCFCVAHDTNLFKEIETGEIDFLSYRKCLLFTLRTIYNEKYRKIVNVNMNQYLIDNHSDLFVRGYLMGAMSQESLGLEDIEKTEKLIWNDLNNETESFVFKTRQISRKEICLSSFYNYETSVELNDYFKKNRKQKETIIDIFVNLFPYKDYSVFMMGYKKNDETVVKGYINEFFSDNEKRLERKITNLLMFLCETWIISPSFYNKFIKGNDSFFGDAANFSHNNMNERKFFDINIFRNDFSSKYKIFKKNREQLITHL